MEKLEDLLNKVIDLGVNVIIGLILLFIGFKLIKVLDNKLKKPHKFSKLDEGTKSFIVSIITISLKILLFVIVAGIVGIPTTSIITIIGSSALAIGLALQGGLSNLASGVMIIFFKPFKVGDYISCSGNEGIVKNINIFYTMLSTLDNKVVQIPNATLTSNNIVNYTYNKKRRIDLEFGVSYDSKIDKVKKVINEVIDKSDLILKDEERVVRLLRHDASSLTFIVRVWALTPNYWNTLYELEENIKEAFDKNKIEIPYNQLDVHMK